MTGIAQYEKGRRPMVEAKVVVEDATAQCDAWKLGLAGVSATVPVPVTCTDTRSPTLNEAIRSNPSCAATARMALVINSTNTSTSKSLVLTGGSWGSSSQTTFTFCGISIVPKACLTNALTSCASVGVCRKRRLCLKLRILWLTALIL